HTIEKDKLSFVPLPGLEPKVMCSRPVVEIRNWLDVIRPAFTRRPHAYDLDSQTGGLLQSLRHAGAIFVAVHHGHVRAYEAKRLAVDHESSTVGLHKRGPAPTPFAAPL